MSMWTHIVAVIDVDTYTENKDIQSVVEEMLKNAPLITGSEREADVFVNVLSGYNSSTNCDCKSCVYKDTIELLKEGGFKCGADENYQCPEGKYQTRVAITVIGDLRDRMKVQTEKEWNKFNDYVATRIKGESGFEIRNCACEITSW